MRTMWYYLFNILRSCCWFSVPLAQADTIITGGSSQA